MDIDKLNDLLVDALFDDIMSDKTRIRELVLDHCEQHVKNMSEEEMLELYCYITGEDPK